ncbi:phosphonate metabolism transcriptional regulator PhnF [Tistrella mobilis]|uniref:Phosphonate metabolism transcriptional regulator PhnF n=2 Tax=Tistrella mobilis TaxID=171437 RepID=A0A162LF38_9PROT|nr:phosphonate metabolism transcriptional regulator PhnF [Tistrella mobilis]
MHDAAVPQQDQKGDRMAIDREPGVTLWRQIERVLADEIQRGIMTPGAQLATEHQLAERFGANRHTVRRAIRELKTRGLIRVEQGRGTFVHENVMDYALGPRTRFSANLKAQERRPAGMLLEAAAVAATGRIAEGLGVAEGAPLIYLTTLSFADNVPVSLGRHYLEFERFRGIDEVFRETPSMTLALTRFDIHDYTRGRTRITARMPSAEEAGLLRQPPNRPVLKTEYIDVDVNGRPVQYGITLFAGDRVQIVTDPRNPDATDRTDASTSM